MPPPNPRPARKVIGKLPGAKNKALTMHERQMTVLRMCLDKDPVGEFAGWSFREVLGQPFDYGRMNGCIGGAGIHRVFGGCEMPNLN